MPVADIVVLSSLQAGLVALIGSFSCRELEWATVQDYTSAVGVSAVGGLGAREVARSLVQLAPVGGQAISGAVAAGTTWAIGRSAEEYFSTTTWSNRPGCSRRERTIPRREVPIAISSLGRDVPGLVIRNVAVSVRQTAGYDRVCIDFAVMPSNSSYTTLRLLEKRDAQDQQSPRQLLIRPKHAKIAC
ncbi:hypothetical protein D8S78_14810 [Natrialba swarupiae]|nr:hypothetical protein [Natrialba swarupiae]